MDTAFLRSITSWIISALVIFASLLQSDAIVWINRPSKPTIIVEGVNSTGVKLEWNFLLHSGDVVQSVFLQRQRRGNPPIDLASRHSNNAFTFLNSVFLKEYDAKLPNTLVLRDVNSNKEYFYSIIVNYVRNNIVQIPLEDQVEVIVYAPPRITKAPVLESEVSVGQKLTLTCNASGDPTPNIKWAKDGVPRSKFHVSGQKLNLANVQRKDIGSYRCTASNRYGVASSISMVTIHCPPGQCTVLEVGITITNVQWRQELAKPQTREYTMLKSNLSTDIASIYTTPNNADYQFYGMTAVKFRPGFVAVVQLKFHKNVASPLKPLQDDVSDGNLGPFEVSKQLDLNPKFRSTASTLKTTNDFETVPYSPSKTDQSAAVSPRKTWAPESPAKGRRVASTASNTCASIKSGVIAFVAGTTTLLAVIRAVFK